MLEPLLSVVIATRNRYEYCIIAIDQILKLLNIDAELVIQDNSDDDRLSKIVDAKKDNRIAYHYYSMPLSFVANFNQAIERCRGKYICLLGDDDAVTEDINQVIKWMNANEIESLTPKSNVDYIWPNTTIHEYNTGQLSIPDFSGACFQINAEQQLEKLLAAGIINYQRFALPRIYHGIVSRKALLSVKKRAGHFFGGLTPDIYATISLSCVVKKHFVIDYPFTIAGACPASASVISQTGGHSGDLQIAPHFNYRGEYNWNNAIPSYYSVETIWAETSLKALYEMNRSDLVAHFARFRFIYESILLNRKYIPKLAIQQSFLHYKRGVVPTFVHAVKMIIYMPYFLAIKSMSVFKNRILYKHLAGNTYKQNNVFSLAEAIGKTKDYLKPLSLAKKS